MLSFILSYTLWKTNRFREGFLSITIFGIGFVTAALLIGMLFGLTLLLLPKLKIYTTLLMCAFATFFSLNLLGLINLPLRTRPLIKKLSKKFVTKYFGILILGFVFYFLDPCIAPIFVSMLPLLSGDSLPIVLFVFCLGVIIPFIGVGIFAGSISKLVRSFYVHRFKIRAASGLVLIGYVLYVILLYFLWPFSVECLSVATL